MSKEAARRAVIMLVAAYPRQEFPLVSQKVYAESLEDLDDELLAVAITHLKNTATFLPAISEIRKAVAELLARTRNELDAYAAWDVVSKAIVRVGYTGRPDFDELTRRAVDATGGWWGLCMSENSVADRARFVAAYETFQSRARSDSVIHPEVAQLVERMTAKRLGNGNRADITEVER